MVKGLIDLRKEANATLKSDFEGLASADKIISLADRPGALSAGVMIGQMQVLRENKPSVLREGEYKVALDNQKFDERVKNFLSKYSVETPEVLGPTMRAEYKEIANILKSAIYAGMADRAQPIISSARAMGASDDDIKKQVFSPRVNKYVFPSTEKTAPAESKKQEGGFYPTPSGKAPKPNLGSIPLSKMQERSRVKNKPLDQLIEDAISQGYTIDRSK
jgi:hypothetical protein